jgi:Zn finger protein HypA/HybF involved in hydrogenase expression
MFNNICCRCDERLQETIIEIKSSLVGQETIIKDVEAYVCPKCHEINITPFESAKIDRLRREQFSSSLIKNHA